MRNGNGRDDSCDVHVHKINELSDETCVVQEAFTETSRLEVNTKERTFSPTRNKDV